MKIALIGYGKMGRAIDELAAGAGHEVVMRIDQEERPLLTDDKLDRADVAIEFTGPESAFDNIRFCLEAGLPVVSGSTGWLDRMAEVRTLCAEQDGAFFYAPNFSIGVNLFFILNRYLAELMEPWEMYDVSLEEVHHTEKLDSPSGTAVRLAEDILATTERKNNWVNAAGESPQELAVISHRRPGIPGTHTIKYRSAIDAIEIRHTAYSREGFARGALQAAAWLVGRTGFFGMEDLLRDFLGPTTPGE